MRNVGLDVAAGNSIVEEASEVKLSFGDVELHSPNASNITVGDRSIDFFFDPNNFPVSLDDEIINMEMTWADDGDTMFVQRVHRDSDKMYSYDSQIAEEVSLDVTGMSEHQLTVTFMYLLGELRNDVCS